MSLENILYVFNQKEPTNASQRLVLLVLADMSNAENETWPGIALIAQRASMSERCVHYSIKALKTAGLIDINQGGKYRGDSNTYVILKRSDSTPKIGVSPGANGVVMGANCAVTGANGAPVGVQTVQSTGANGAPHPSGNPNILTLSEPGAGPDGQRPTSLSVAQVYFVSEGGIEADAAAFFDHYEMNGWKIKGGGKVVSWHAAARRWVRTNRAPLAGSSGPKNFGGGGAGAASTHTFGVTPASRELNKLLNDPNWTGGITPDPHRSASDGAAA